MSIDVRFFQILFLCGFLLLGIVTRDWALDLWAILIAILTCCICQMVGRWVEIKQQGDKEALQVLVSQILVSDGVPGSMFLSPLITALGLSLLLRSQHHSTIVLASSAAILSKFLLRVGQKHLFNPANFGIVTALTFTQDAWVSPGQWGEEGWYALLFLATGGLVLNRVGRWDTTGAFLSVYGGLEAWRNLWLGWSWDVWAHRLMSGSLLLFAFFMMTDPRSIPNARVSRLIWAVAIALLTFVLRNFFFLSTSVFWALFLLAPLTILLDRVFLAEQFAWGDRTSDSAEC